MLRYFYTYVKKRKKMTLKIHSLDGTYKLKQIII